MSFATVRFFNNFPTQKEAGQVPIFTNATTESAVAAGTHATYPAAFSWTDVKVRRDAGDQVLQLPVDTADIANFERCSVAVIVFSNYHRWYWITDFIETTNSAYPNGSSNKLSYQVTLQYMPVTTGMNLSTSITILPERLPTATDRVMQNWTQSIMMPTSTTTALPALPKLGTVSKGSGSGSANVGMLWCEISFVISNQVKRYGIFIPRKQVYNSTYSANVYAGPLNSLNDGYDLYPSLAQIMNDPITYLGISGATITDVNISEFCPYITSKAVTNVSQEEYVRIVSQTNAMLSPTNVYTLMAQKYYAYDLTQLYLDWAGTGNESSRPKTNNGTLSIALTDFEKMNGQLSVKDSMRNDVITFPREILKSAITLNYFVYSDNNNIYLVLEYDGSQITMSGHKIPWATSMWNDYRAFSLQFDRQALQNNIDAANRELEISMTDAAANGIIGGTLAGAVTGGWLGAGVGLFSGASSFASGMVSGNIKRDETVRKLRRDQELTEQRMKAGATTMNNIGAGFGVIKMINEFGGAELIFRMPANFTSTEWTYQTGVWGYPSNKVLTTKTVSAGYWKGRVTYATGLQNNTSNGVMMNLMIDEFNNGIRIIKVV